MTKGWCQPGQPPGRLHAEVAQLKPAWILADVNLDNLVNLFNIKDYMCGAYEDDVPVQKRVKKVGKVAQVDQPLSGSGFSKVNLKERGCPGAPKRRAPSSELLGHYEQARGSEIEDK